MPETKMTGNVVSSLFQPRYSHKAFLLHPDKHKQKYYYIILLYVITMCFPINSVR